MLDVHCRFDARLVRVACRALVLSGAMLLSTLVSAGHACAQVVTLPTGTNTKPQLGPEDEQAIAKFIEQEKAKLVGADADAMRAARRDVLTLLQPEGVSVSFKLTLGKSLVPLLKQMVDSGDEVRVVNALRMAGELATQPCVEILLSKLSDPNTTIRLAAAAGINRALESLSRQAPAMQVGGAITLINAVAARLKDEQDPSAMDPMIRALLAALQIQDSNLTEARSIAFKQLSLIMGERVQKLGNKPASDRMMENIIRAASGVRDALTGAGGKSVPQDAIKEAAGFGGETLAYVRRLLKANAYPQIAGGDTNDAQESKRAARASGVQLVIVAEAVVFYARTATESQTPQATKLADGLKNATTPEDARFAEDVLGLIGPQGALVKSYGFPADRFTK